MYNFVLASEVGLRLLTKTPRPYPAVCLRPVRPSKQVFFLVRNPFLKFVKVDCCWKKWKLGSDCHCDVIFYWKIKRLVVKCTRQVQTQDLLILITSNFANPISNVVFNDFCKKKNWKSGSDCHCDVTFDSKMTKLMVKCTRQIQTRHIFVRTISNFAKQISNVDIIDFCKKKFENRVVTVNVTSLLTLKWQN